MKVLANDGISQSGINALQEANFEVITTTVAQEQLEDYINNEEITVLLVRSATTVRKNIIDNCASLKIIGRGGVGMDNIDVEYAREKGLAVINTPAASSQSVAELVFAHLYNGVRFLYDSNRNMPLEGDSKFKALKKSYEEKIPCIVISASGGARMQEGALSLMQMAKISGKLGQLADAGLPYISYLTDPTTGGVTASFAMLGDINVAEPGALIAFAGPRVVKETIGRDLPEGFQTSEFLLDHGFLDFIIDITKIRERLSLSLELFAK